MISAAERFLPTLRRDLRFYEISRWNEVVVHAQPGHYQRLRRFIERCAATDTRIRLAGDFVGVASIDTASAGGERTAAGLIRTLDLPAPAPTPEASRQIEGTL